MGVLFNKKRRLTDYLRMIKWYAQRLITGLPYRLTARRRKLPDFIIIGARKAGTTSLFEYLKQHPDVKMARESELNFFSSHYYRSKLYYRSFFPLKTDNRITGERSTYYLIHPHVPKRIKKDIPHAKIIVLLRDQVKRAHSQYQMNKGIDTAADFKEALKLEAQRLNKIQAKIQRRKHSINLANQVYSYITGSMYFKHLTNWFESFDREKMLILKSEDFFENPRTELAKVYQFLGVKAIFPPDLSPKNQRIYNDLSENDYMKYKALFKADSQKLKQLLGEHFSWQYNSNSGKHDK